MKTNIMIRTLFLVQLIFSSDIMVAMEQKKPSSVTNLSAKKNVTHKKGSSKNQLQLTIVDYLMNDLDEKTIRTLPRSQTCALLCIAALSNSDTILGKLLLAGISVEDHRDEKKNTTLHYMVKLGDSALTGTNRLLSWGCKQNSCINQQNISGNTALATIIMQSWDNQNEQTTVKRPVSWNNYLETIALLLTNGAKISIPLVDTPTAFHAAVQQGATDVVRTIIQNSNINDIRSIDLVKTQDGFNIFNQFNATNEMLTLLLGLRLNLPTDSMNQWEQIIRENTTTFDISFDGLMKLLKKKENENELNELLKKYASWQRQQRKKRLDTLQLQANNPPIPQTIYSSPSDSNDDSGFDLVDTIKSPDLWSSLQK